MQNDGGWKTHNSSQGCTSDLEHTNGGQASLVRRLCVVADCGKRENTRGGETGEREREVEEGETHQRAWATTREVLVGRRKMQQEDPAVSAMPPCLSS